jgi:hypothetical protein
VVSNSSMGGTIDWGSADGWVGGLLTAIALILTYLLLRQQAKALDEQRAALADERAERRRDFFRAYGISLRPVLQQARSAFGDITASGVVDRSFKDPLAGPLLTALGDILPAAAVDPDLADHVGGVHWALKEIWAHSVAPVGRDAYGNAIVDGEAAGVILDAARAGANSAKRALERLSKLESPLGFA